MDFELYNISELDPFYTGQILLSNMFHKMHFLLVWWMAAHIEFLFGKFSISKTDAK